MLNNFVLVVVQAGETGVCAEMFGGGVLASRAAREKSRDVSCVFNPFSPSHERPVRSCWCFSPRFSVREIEDACSHSRPSACSMVARHEQRSLARLEPSEKKSHSPRATSFRVRARAFAWNTRLFARLVQRHALREPAARHTCATLS